MRICRRLATSPEIFISASSVATAVPLRWITSTAAISGPISRSTTHSRIFTASAASASSTSIT